MFKLSLLNEKVENADEEKMKNLHNLLRLSFSYAVLRRSEIIVASLNSVIPAKAGIQVSVSVRRKRVWIPTCAGMTERG